MKLKSIAEAEESNKLKKELDRKIETITNFIKENKSDMEVIKPILELTKSLGYTNPTLITNTKDADKVLKLIK